MTLVKRPCVVHKCPSYAVPGKSRCDEHERERQRKGWEEGRTGSRGSRPGWRRLRARVWREQGERCKRCSKKVKRFIVHHRDGNALDDSRSNVEGLCEPCAAEADRALRSGHNDHA